MSSTANDNGGNVLSIDAFKARRSARAANVARVADGTEEYLLVRCADDEGDERFGILAPPQGMSAWSLSPDQMVKLAMDMMRAAGPHISTPVHDDDGESG